MFNICYFNSRSINCNNKLDEIKSIFEDVDVHAICVSETWLKDNINSNLVKLENFNLFRNDRTDKRGGGVCIYIRSCFKAKVIYVSSNKPSDVLLLEITVLGETILLGVCYNPPKTDFISHLEFVLDYSVSYKHFILCGDFNYHIETNCRQSKLFKDVLSNFSINILNSEPTCFFQDSRSLIDLMLCNNDSMLFLNQISIPGISDHDLLFCSYDIPTFIDDESITYRDFRSIDMLDLIEKCNELPLLDIYHMVDVNDQLNFFNLQMKSLFDISVPIKTIIINKLKSPEWLNHDIKNIIESRDIAYANWKKVRNPRSNKKRQKFTTFKILRNKTNKMKRKAKGFHVKTKLNPKLKSKTFWNNVKTFGIGKQTVVTSIPFSPDTLNAHYCPPRTRNSTSNFHINTSIFDENVSFSFGAITFDDITKAIYSIKSQAIGLDEISIKFLKLIFPEISQYILFIFNNIITKSVFPECWKVAKIIPIAKIKNPTKESDFRPISILPSLSKAFEKILKGQIVNYLNDKSLLCSVQSAYRQHHSTTSTLLNISDDIRRQADQGKFTALALLDFSKAFDCIDHDILTVKLKHYFNFSTYACQLIKSYLEDRKQKVSINNELSNSFDLFCGVPQGSVLGPLIFSLFINDIVNVVSHSKIHLFADDCQLYLSDSIINNVSTIEKLNEDLQLILNWAVVNKLTLNAKKTQAIVVYKQKIDLTTFPSVVLNSVMVPYSETVKNLGIIMDSTLTWSMQINKVCARVYNILRSLWKLTISCSSSLRQKLFMAFILPHFLYADVVIFGMYEYCLFKLKRLFNACIRYVHNLQKFDHISEYSKSLLGCNISEYYDFRICLYIYNLIKHKEPKYIYEKLSFTRSTRTLQILLPKNKFVILNSSFFVRGVNMWNMLPFQIRSAGSSDSFKKMYFLNLDN